MKRLAEILLFATAILLAAVALVLLSPILLDYDATFQPAAFNWLIGKADLYTKAHYLNPPWFAATLLPIVSLPLGVAQVLLTAASLGFIIFSTKVFGTFPAAVIAFSLLNRNVLNLLGCGESDAFVLLGTSLGYIAARKRNTSLLAISFLLMAVKPQNAILAGMLYLWETRDWKAVALCACFSLAFVPFLGIDYPLRMIQSYGANPPPALPETTLWRFASDPIPLAVLGIAALAGLVYAVHRQGLNEWTLALALATNLTFTPYALSAHYVLLNIPLVFIARRNLWMPFLLFLVSWVSVVSGRVESYLLYPTSILAVLWGDALAGRILAHRARQMGLEKGKGCSDLPERKEYNPFARVG